MGLGWVCLLGLGSAPGVWVSSVSQSCVSISQDITRLGESSFLATLGGGLVSSDANGVVQSSAARGMIGAAFWADAAAAGLNLAFLRGCSRCPSSTLASFVVCFVFGAMAGVRVMRAATTMAAAAWDREPQAA